MTKIPETKDTINLISRINIPYYKVLLVLDLTTKTLSNVPFLSINTSTWNSSHSSKTNEIVCNIFKLNSSNYHNDEFNNIYLFPLSPEAL